MTEAFTKADIAKVKKLEEALDILKSGQQKYFGITKLISIKSLCHNQEIRRAYCFYLFDCVIQRIRSKSLDDTSVDIKFINDISNMFDEMKHENYISDDILYEYQCIKSKHQSEFEKSVSVIAYLDFGIIEYIVGALCADEDSWAAYVYYATRMYVEKYNSSIGNGLITDSIPFFEDVLEFWKGVALTTKLNALRK
jgi:hypothetical protein